MLQLKLLLEVWENGIMDDGFVLGMEVIWDGKIWILEWAGIIIGVCFGNLGISMSRRYQC